MDLRSILIAFSQFFLFATLITFHSGCSNSDDAIDPPGGPEKPKPPEDEQQVAPGHVAFSSSTVSISEGAGQVELTVVRQGDASESARVEFRTLAGSAAARDDFVSQTNTLTWPAGNTDSQTISITIVADEEVEPAETFDVELFNNNGAELNATSKMTVTINDDDQEQVTCIELDDSRITENTILAHPCYTVTSDVTVSANATLTIKPGVNLIFNAGVELFIEDDGLLHAVGTEVLPIVFTGAIETPGFWDGIRIESIAPSSLHHTFVLYGGGSDAIDPGNVRLRGKGAASIEHSQFQFSGSYALNLGRDTVLNHFENNTLTLNQSAPVRIHVNDVYTLTDSNTFTGNTSINGTENDRDFISIDQYSPTVSSNQKWQELGVPYRMPGRVTNISAILEVEPGVELQFRTSGRLNIERDGTLKAVGTVEEPVLFTGVDKASGSWEGIQFTFSGGDNVLQHVIVEYGGVAGNTAANVGVFGQDGRLTIKDATLRHSVAHGFEFSHAVDLVFERVTVVDNQSAGSIFISDLDEIDTESRFVGNSADIIEVTTGGVSNQLTIHDLGVPFVITGNISVNTDWTIQAGSELRFRAGTRVDITRQGSLAITGTEDQPVILTGVQPVPGYWVGLQYTFSSSQLNVIEHAIIEYAGSADGNTEALVGYFGQGSHGVIKNSILRGSATHGVWLHEDTTGEFEEGVVFEDIAGDTIYRDL